MSAWGLEQAHWLFYVIIINMLAVQEALRLDSLGGVGGQTSMSLLPSLEINCGFRGLGKEK